MIQKQPHSGKFEPGEDIGNVQNETGRKSLLWEIDTTYTPFYRAKASWITLWSSLLEQKTPIQRLGEAAERTW